MRALLVAPFFSLDWEGNRTVVIGEVLSRLGEIEVITGDWDHQAKRGKRKLDWDRASRVVYLRVPPYHHNVSFARLWSHFVFAARAVRWFLRERSRFDVVYVSLPLNLAAASILCLSSKKRRICDVVDIWPDVLPFPQWVRRLGRPVLALWRLLFVAACRRATIMLAVSDTFLSVAAVHFRGGANHMARFYPCHARLPTEPQSQADGPIGIAYVGNIGHLYDFETLLSALELPHTADRYQLHLIGDGDRREWLLKECERRQIRYAHYGIVFEPLELAAILCKCSIGFNGYRNTSAAFSYKATTYLAAQLPLLNSMTGDLDHLVRTRGIGVNYVYGNTESLALALQAFKEIPAEHWRERCETFFAQEVECATIRRSLAAFLKDLMSADAQPTIAENAVA